MIRLTSCLLFLTLICGLHAAEKPNVIVIYTDDQGYGDASCLNPDSKFQTPNLDRLAAEGMTFTDAHCSDTVCTPSRYGLLTGRYNWRTTLKTGVFGAEEKCLIEDGRMTLASLLRDHGYQTAMVGKWHLGMDFPGEFGNRDWSQPVQDMPLDKGFDYFWGIPASMNYGVLAWFEGRHAAVPPTLYTRKKLNEVAISDYRIMPPYESEPDGPKDLEVAPDFVDHECLTRFTDKAMEWIKQTDREKPFFVYLPYTSPHKPVVPIEQFLGKSGAGAYGDFMMETDWHLGRILQMLDEEGLAENTMIVYSSDNGPENTWPERKKRYDHASNGIYRGGKRDIYEGGHRVPFFVRWPAKVEAGSTWDEPVSQMDILATLAEMLGATLPDDAGEDSFSFYHALTGNGDQPDRPPLVHHAMKGQFAVRDGDWKLVMAHGKDEMQLFNLAEDPSETTNLLGQHPEITKGLQAKLTKIVLKGRSTEGEAQPNDTGWWDDLTWIPEADYPAPN